MLRRVCVCVCVGGGGGDCPSGCEGGDDDDDDDDDDGGDGYQWDRKARRLQATL